MLSHIGIRCTAIAGLVVLSMGGGAATQTAAPAAAEERELTKSYERSEQGGNGSSHASGSDALRERVLRVRDDGLELEYDLPKSTKAEDRARSWQFPVRVFKPLKGPAELLNGSELQSRADVWLEAAKLDRTACGRWIFTWNAFQIECDPRSAVKAIEDYDLRSVVARDGEPYHDARAAWPGSLGRTNSQPSGETYTTTMDVDPEVVRRERAKMEVAAAEIMRRTLTLDTALGERRRENVSGTITITLETDATGRVWRRTKETRLETSRPGGRPKTATAIEIVTSRTVSDHQP